MGLPALGAVIKLILARIAQERYEGQDQGQQEQCNHPTPCHAPHGQVLIHFSFVPAELAFLGPAFFLFVDGSGLAVRVGLEVDGVVFGWGFEENVVHVEHFLVEHFAMSLIVHVIRL